MQIKDSTSEEASEEIIELQYNQSQIKLTLPLYLVRLRLRDCNPTY